MQNTKPAKSSAPYGQACLNCVKAKSRCILRGDAKCERCHRLDKECVPSATVRKRSANHAKVSKRAKLEDKLDDLVTLLRTQQGPPSQDHLANQQIVTPSSLDYSPEQSGCETPCNISLTDRDLANFREVHLAYFPLLCLPAALSAEELSQEKPMLALAIKTISNKAGFQQAQLSESLRSQVARRLFVDGEKSLDILISMLVGMAWSVYFTSGKKFLVMFSGIARSLASDLRVDKPRFPAWCPSIAPNCEEGVEQSNESRRTLLACYAITAIISMTFKSDIMSWSSQLEENCAKLSSDAETEGDHILIAMVRVSRLCVRATEVHRLLYDESDTGRHVTMHVASLKTSLETLRATLSETQRCNDTVAAYLYATEVAIYELAILPPHAATSQYGTILDHQRSEYLMACMRSCQAWTDRYLNSDLIKMTMASGLLFSYCLKTLHKLLTLQDPIWDTTLVRETVDVVALLERCADAADKSNAQLKKETGEESVFFTAAKTLREMAPNWRTTIAQESHDVVAENWNAADPIDLSLMDFSGDFWLNAPFDV